MNTFQVYIPSDMIATFPKVAETFPEGDVWVDMMPSSERNTPLWEASLKKAQNYGLWVRVLWPSSSFHCIKRGIPANKPPRTGFACPDELATHISDCRIVEDAASLIEKV
jgi:hypothetical protein